MAVTNEQLFKQGKRILSTTEAILGHVLGIASQLRSQGEQMTELSDKLTETRDALDRFSDRENLEDANAELAADLARSTIAGLEAVIADLQANQVTPENLAALEEIRSNLEQLNAEAPPTPPEEPVEEQLTPVEPPVEEQPIV